MKIEDIFRDCFSAIAVGPGGIERLRAMLLELAFRGKLVPLLESEKSGMPSKTAIAGPFALPAGWRWTTLKNSTKTWNQKVPDRAFTYIDVASINNTQGRVGSDLKIIEPKAAPSRARKIVREGTVIFSTVRPYLKNVAIIERDYQPEPIVSTAFSVLHPLEILNNRFLYHYLRSPALMEYVSAEMTGMAYPAITDRKLLDAPIPIPPLEEQHRIVEKVDLLMALCDDLERRRQAEQEERRRLRTASLAALENAATAEEAERAWAHIAREFGRLVDTVEDVAELRKGIIQAAITGRLSSADSGSTWKSSYLKDITKRIHYGYTASADPSIVDIRLLRITDIQNNRVQWDRVPGCSISESDFAKFQLHDGDILIARTGGTVGKSFLVTDLPVDAVFASYLIRLELSSGTDPRYLKLFLESPSYWIQLIGKCQGTGQPNVNATSLGELRISVPPVFEQHQILEQVDRLMIFCETLEAVIRARDAALEAFAGAACRAVLDVSVPVGAPAPAAVGATGQQRLPV